MGRGGRVGLLVVLILGGVTAWGYGAQRRQYDVTYLVTSSLRVASVAYSDATGGIQQVQEAPAPWRYTFVAHSGQQLAVNVTTLTAASVAAEVTCAIQIDRRTVNTSVSKGLFAVATCAFGLP